jgi:hypothetical protein
VLLDQPDFLECPLHRSVMQHDAMLVLQKAGYPSVAVAAPVEIGHDGLKVNRNCPRTSWFPGPAERGVIDVRRYLPFRFH